MCAGAVWACGLLLAEAALASPAFVPVSGSPFATDLAPESVAFSPSGGLLATANTQSDSVSVFSVSSGGGLTQVSGSPFSTGGGSGPTSIAFSPSGGLLAVAEQNRDGVGVFSVSSGGGLTQVSGSPFATNFGSTPESVAFSPSGGLLAVAEQNHDGVGVFSVSSAGGLTQASWDLLPPDWGTASAAFSPSGRLLAVANGGDALLPNRPRGNVAMFSVSPGGKIEPTSPFTTDVNSHPESVAFSPHGGLLALADSGTDGVSMFTVSSAGGLTAVSGSPFSTGPGSAPISVAFNPSGDLVAVGNQRTGVSLLSASSDGRLTPVSGPPSSLSVAFSPSGTLLATINALGGGVSVSEVAGPTVRIVSPAGGVFGLRQRVRTSFSCSDLAFAPGIASCTGSNGGSGSHGYLNTSTRGSHTYTVTATSKDGQSSTAKISYRVVRLRVHVHVSPHLTRDGLLKVSCRAAHPRLDGCALRAYGWRDHRRVLVAHGRTDRLSSQPRGVRRINVRRELAPEEMSRLSSSLAGRWLSLRVTGEFADGAHRRVTRRVRVFKRVQSRAGPAGMFQRHDAKLTVAGRRFLRRVDDHARRVLRVRCTGHTARLQGRPVDSRLARRLSLARGSAACRYLRALGLHARFHAVGAGDAHQRASGLPRRARRAENRYVDLTIWH